jgi:hypothetical protein
MKMIEDVQQTLDDTATRHDALKIDLTSLQTSKQTNIDPKMKEELQQL